MESFYKTGIQSALKQNFSFFNNPKGNRMHSQLIKNIIKPQPVSKEPIQAEATLTDDLINQKDIETKARTELMRSIYAESDCV